MTLNGVRTACNQTSGRDPVLSLGELEVQAALDRLRAQGLTRVVHPSHGARTPKHRQVLDEVLGLDAGGARRRHPPPPAGRRRRPASSGRGRIACTTSTRSTRSTPRSTCWRCATTRSSRSCPASPGQKEARWIHRLGPVDGPGAGRRPSGVVFPTGPARDAKVVDAYDAVATAYADELLDELDRKPFDRWLLERIAELSADGPVADVGCGPGQIDRAPRDGRRRRHRASTCRPAWSPRRAAASRTSRSRSPT